jgi:hypothetical protein
LAYFSKRAVENILEALRFHVYWLFVSGLGSSDLGSALASGLGSALASGLGSLGDLRGQIGRCLGFGSRFVLLFQKFVDALSSDAR